jgi:hypothetical protein
VVAVRPESTLYAYYSQLSKDFFYRTIYLKETSVKSKHARFQDLTAANMKFRVSTFQKTLKLKFKDVYDITVFLKKAIAKNSPRIYELLHLLSHGHKTLNSHSEYGFNFAFSFTELENSVTPVQTTYVRLDT